MSHLGHKDRGFVHAFYKPLNYDISTPEGMANAVEWQLKLFSVIGQGGRWIVPRSGTIYTIHHKTKTAVRQLGFLPEPDIERVIKAAGWTVIAMVRAPGTPRPSDC